MPTAIERLRELIELASPSAVDAERERRKSRVDLAPRQTTLRENLVKEQAEESDKKAVPEKSEDRPGKPAEKATDAEDAGVLEDVFAALLSDDPDYEDYDDEGFYNGPEQPSDKEPPADEEESPAEEEEPPAAKEEPPAEEEEPPASKEESPVAKEEPPAEEEPPARRESPAAKEEPADEALPEAVNPALGAAGEPKPEASPAVEKVGEAAAEGVEEAVEKKTEAALEEKAGEKKEAPGIGVEGKDEKGAIAPARLGAYMAQKEAKEEEAAAPPAPPGPPGPPAPPGPPPPGPGVPPGPPVAPGPPAPPHEQEVPNDFPGAPGGMPVPEEPAQAPTEKEPPLGKAEEDELSELEMEPEIIPTVAIGASVVSALGDVTAALEAATAAVEYAEGGDFGPELQQLQQLADQATEMLAGIKRKATAKVQQASEDYGKRQVQQNFYSRFSKTEDTPAPVE